MPKTWTPAVLSFQISFDGATYNDLFDNDGREIAYNIQPATVTPVDPGQWTGASPSFLRLRSGTRGNPIAQASTAIFAINLADPRQARGAAQRRRLAEELQANDPT
jgi:hypothetical protein